MSIMPHPFDLIEAQTAIKKIMTPKALYEASEEVSKLKLSGIIGDYEFQECNDHIRDRFALLKKLKESLES